MSPELDRLLCRLEPASDDNLPLRLQFGLRCVERVAHLMEQDEALACLQAFKQAVEQGDGGRLPALGAQADRVAQHHQGSKSLDGVGHAAVSATYACAKAIAGKARQAAEYAAYAAVYGQGGYGATSDPAAFQPEYAWQAGQLRQLLASSSALPESR